MTAARADRDGTDTATTLAQSVREGTRDPRALVEEALARIARDGAETNALRSVDREGALRAAEAVAARLAAGETDLPLAGVPLVVKDNLARRGEPTLAGRREDAAAPEAEDARLVERLRDAGAIVVGRANMDELAYGVTGTNVHTGPVRNPWDPERHPGGSSAGSAAAVAAGLVPLAVGTDTGGSVRIPAALCGLVGLRPTRGLLPLRGVAPLARSLDTAGPLAATVDDAALLLSVLAADPARAGLHRRVDVASLRAVALDGAFPIEVDAEVRERFEETLGILSEAGVRIRRRSVPALAGAARASGPIIGAEASHAWAAALDENEEAFGEQVRGLLRKGAQITAVRYLKAWDDAHRVLDALDALFEETELLLLPTTATAASPIADPGDQLRFLALTAPFSLSGHPAASVPMGLAGGLPVGLQIAARRGREDLALAAAAVVERARPLRPA